MTYFGQIHVKMMKMRLKWGGTTIVLEDVLTFSGNEKNNYRAEAATPFLNKNDFLSIIRAHEAQLDG